MRYSRLVGSALISVVVLVATLSALPVAAAPQANGEQTVYVTRTGKKYHTAGCRYLRYSQREMKLKDAVAAGYTPCRVCNPPILRGAEHESRNSGNPDVKVWVNTASGVYHCPGSRWYGNTKRGDFMTQKQAQEKGNRPAYRKVCQ